MPFFTGYFKDRNRVKAPLSVRDGTQDPGSVHIIAQQYSQCYIARALPQKRIRNLRLEFLDMTEVMPVHLCLALYLEASPRVETVSVKFGGTSSHREDPANANNEWPLLESGASGWLLFAIEELQCLRESLNPEPPRSNSQLRRTPYCKRLFRLVHP